MKQQTSNKSTGPAGTRYDLRILAGTAWESRQNGAYTSTEPVQKKHDVSSE